MIIFVTYLALWKVRIISIFQYISNRLVLQFSILFLLGIISFSYHFLLLLSFLLVINSKSIKIIFLSFSIFAFGYLLSNQVNSIYEKESEKIHLSKYEGLATIIEPPTESMFFTTATISIRGVEGNVLAKIPSYPEVDYMDKVYISGILRSAKLDENEENQGYYNFLYSKKVWYTLESDVISKENSSSIFITFSKIRRYFINTISNHLSPTSTSLAAGITLGYREKVPNSLEDALIRTGTIHLTSASGFHVGIIYAVSMSLRSVLSKKISYLLSLFAIFTYVLIIGFYILAAQRALFMLAYVIFAGLLGRKYSIWISISISCSIILLQYPFHWKNVGFQLSVVAVTGMLTIGNLFREKLKDVKIPVFIKDSSIATLAATIATLPITIPTFEAFSIITLIANIVVSPFVSLLVILTMFVLLLSPFVPEILLSFLFSLIQIICEIINTILTFLSSFEWAYTTNLIIIFSISTLLITLLVAIDIKKLQYELSKK